MSDTARTCECGCGAAVNERKGKPNRFISGHNAVGVQFVARVRFICLYCKTEKECLPSAVRIFCSKACKTAYSWWHGTPPIPRKTANAIERRAAAVDRATAWNKANIERRREIGRLFAARKSDRRAVLGLRRSNPNPLRSRNIRITKHGKRIVLVGRHTSADIKRIYLRQGALCANGMCLDYAHSGAGQPFRAQLQYGFHIDHILPISRSGTNNPDNLQLLCPRCNSQKRDMTMEEYMRWQMERITKDIDARSKSRRIFNR